MKLNLAHQLLVAADEQTYGFLRVRGPDLTYEVELLTEAGLVESSINRSESEVVAVINRVTDSGRAFIRAFRGERRVDSDSRSQVGASAGQAVSA